MKLNINWAKIIFTERCDAPKAPANGYVQCESDDLKKGVSCYSGCNEGKLY